VELGHVDVVRNDRSKEVLVGSFQQGDYFGNATGQGSNDCIRARTRVRLLSMEHEAAQALSAVRPEIAVLFGAGSKSTPAAQSI
jgi:hypothetical protein